MESGNTVYAFNIGVDTYRPIAAIHFNRQTVGVLCVPFRPRTGNRCRAIHPIGPVAIRPATTLGDRTPWLQPVLALPHAKVDVPPTDGSVWILGEEQLMETIDAEKPKTKLASGRIAEIVAELERVKVT